MRKKRMFAQVLCLAMAGSAITPAGTAMAETWEAGQEKNYLVVLREDASSDINTMLDGVDVVDVSDHRNYMVLSMTSEEAAALSQDDRIVSVEEDIIVTAQTQEDDLDTVVVLEDLVKQPKYEWNLTAIHAAPDELAAYQTDESQVRVAVLDSGTSVSENLDVEQYINLVSAEQEVTTYDEDGTGHGTAVAGILAANDDGEGIVGVAPDVTLYSVKVFDYSNAAPISRIIEGIYWAIDHDIHIINMSFGTNVNSYALHQAVKAAQEADILMVAAAGNNAAVEYPAAYPEVIAVGATDYQGKRASFSAVGEALELVAPGECVLTSSFYGGIMALNGTSLSAPHVAGAAAVLWAKDMSKSSDFIRQLLNASANRSLGAAEEYGNGLLDVQHAFEIYQEFEANYVPGLSDYAGITENTEPYVMGENPGYVMGSWGKIEHYVTINLGKGKYTTANLELMKDTSRYLDVNGDFKAGTISNFHGGKNSGSKSKRETTNYVNDVIFLYNCAKAIKGMSSSSSLLAQQTKVEEVAESMQRSNSVTIDSKFVIQVKLLLERTVDSALTVAQTTVAENTYKLLGAAVHLAGDAYAHRSIVPRNSVENTVKETPGTIPTSNVYNLNDFGSGTACTLSKIEEKTYNALSDNTAAKCDHRIWECFKLGVENGMMEFKDIWRFVSLKENRHEPYEDNVNFFKTRYSIGTNYTVQVILDSFAEGKELDGKLFLPGVYGGKSYSIRLNALKILYQQIGFQWEPNAGDDWSAYTTSIVR